MESKPQIVGAIKDENCENQKKSLPRMCLELLRSTTPNQHELRPTSPDGNAVPISPLSREKPNLEEEESKERCKFCSTVLPLSKLLQHVPECSEIRAISSMESGETEAVPCPYCGKLFEIVDLVTHAIHCNRVCRMKAEEVLHEDGCPEEDVQAGGDIDGICTSDNVEFDEGEHHENEQDEVDKEENNEPIYDENGDETNNETNEEDCNRDELNALPNSYSEDEGSDNAVVDSEVDVRSDEFEFCLNCGEVFHLRLLVEHSSHCVSDLSDENAQVESLTAAAVSPENSSFPSPPESPIVFCDCHYCGIRLAVDLMSCHYPKCEKQHLEKGAVPKAKSSLNSYRDCEEQCVYCLKMFGVSVLVEHASVCPGLHLSALNDLEQCCYCLRIFPLDDLITHAQNCDQRIEQENCQDDAVANSQSSGGGLLERCMYCFKDFPVSKLIRHSQECDGDMSGPRERFKGFLPSVHDLSANSSVAILNDTQRKALQYVITRSAQDSKSVASALLARVQRLGYSENDLKRTL